MELHANAALTVRQRQEVQRLHQEGVSIRKLAAQFRVNPSTIQRWIKRASPLDYSAAPKAHHTMITPEYRQAVVAYREANPEHGPVRIAQALQADFPEANRGTILRILQEADLTRPPVKAPRPHAPLPVGRHRVQMDVQQLPAIKGGKGYEYKITAIHMRTRLKYSEIHPDHRSETVAGVLQRALDFLPPFFSSGPTTP
jgi:transposase-like protein